MYDLIGDIHGHADELQTLLGKLGYHLLGGVYRHPERQVIFLGDFIDRGPKIRQVLEIVRPMVENGAALAIMGNHELNALAFHSIGPDGKPLREHSEKNVHQHRETLRQLAADTFLADSLAWFRTLPLWLELDGLRAIHACWDDRHVATVTAAIGSGCTLRADDLIEACRPQGKLYVPVEILLKGKEMKLPDGAFITDKDGHVRTEIRTRWYLPAVGETYRSYAFPTEDVECSLNLDATTIGDAAAYPSTAKPVFFGHYWLRADRPILLADNVACLDYSVAKGGYLCAYRWDGEQKLSNDKFIWVEPQADNSKHA